MTINCKGELIDLSNPKVMGILNITPDSFYDGGKFNNHKAILSQVDKMLVEGATFIDIGAYSSRSGATDISEKEELKRLLSIIELIIERFPEIRLSIDTFRSRVAQKCLEAGACLINDISAGFLDTKMMEIVAQFQVPYIMMHMKGNPKTMSNETYYDNLIRDILFYFSERLATSRALKVNDVIIDPGFGFSKTMAQNFELLQKMDAFQVLDVPIMAGISRKSMIYKTLDTSAENALNGTSALHMIALTKGTNILRAHDVKEAVECIKLYNQFPN